MWEEKEFNNVEFIPEPTDNRIVSAADSATVGHQEGWRGEVMGWAPVPVPVVSRPRRTTQRVCKCWNISDTDSRLLGYMA